MRVPYSWLKEYLQTELSLAELCHLLTMGGLEVEGFEEWTAQDGGATEQILMTSVTPNRGDLLSIIGVARHAGALSGDGHSQPASSFPEVDEALIDANKATAGPVTVEIVDPIGCPRYSALLIEGIDVGPSPDWLRYRLEAAGIRSINNVVDCTNYVVWELGQPMHAFDFRLIKDGHIIVRRAEPGEKLLLLDDTWQMLGPEDVVIADPMGAVALAGIMGGADTQMREVTTTVLLESAHFDPVAIRRTSLRLGGTQASYRFERHVDPNLTLPALARAAQLILETAGGAITQRALDVKTADFAPQAIEMRPQRCNAILGTDLDAATMAAYLRRLGCQVEEGEPLAVCVPTFRPDIEREIDLVEEVAIVHGYENISPTVPGHLVASGRLTEVQRLRRRAGELLRECGLHENLSFSMTCAAELDRCCFPSDATSRSLVLLSNPISTELSAMRRALLPALLEAAARNARQRVADVALYEIGTVFHPQKIVGQASRLSTTPPGETPVVPNGDEAPLGEGPDLPHEQQRVAAIMMGSPLVGHWNLPDEQAGVDFYYLKGIVEQMCTGLGLTRVSFVRYEHSMFHPGKCAEVTLGERSLGVMGEIAPEVGEAYDLPGPAYAFELSLDMLLEQATLQRAYRPLRRYPAAERDLAVIVPDSDDFSAVRLAAEIAQAGGQFLESVTPFDVYADAEQFGAEHKSIAFRLIFRAEDRTLTDDELDGAMAEVHRHLEERVGTEVRK